jgi:DNA (cytosine-5)-methyltransferase 3A
MQLKNVLSVFDGISVAQLALKRAGITYNKYYAAEIDKNAVSVAMKHFPDTIQLGDVKELTEFRLNKLGLIGNVDLYIGGSPCTSLSCAAGQKESGLEKGQSVLFWEYVRILTIVKPKFFILENVASMKKADMDTISKVVGVEPILINSALVSAQSRKRLYWTNIQGIIQPENKGIRLKDILIDGYTERDKLYCITATIKNGCEQDYLLKSSRQMVYINPAVIVSINEKGIKKVIEMKPLNEPIQIGYINKNRQGEKIYHINGKSITLTASNAGKYMIADDNMLEVTPETMKGRLRKLYPIECERLQTLPDDYTAGFSNSTRYKMLGNSFTADVMSHILSFIPANSVSKRVNFNTINEHKYIGLWGVI